MTSADSFATLQAKAKERTVRTQNIEYDLETLVKKIDKEIIKLDPDYQRRHRWSNETSSRLIESLILNIPIPLIYISQDIDADTDDDSETARYTVIDGQQRLTAIRRFLKNEFELEDLEVLDDLNGLRHLSLPPFLVRRLEERTIRCLRIDSTVDSQVKYDIFERLNSGAVKLEPQELRNAVSRGPFNTLIKSLAENSDFRTMLQIDPSDPESSKKVKKMEDVELVLRFFALIDGNHKHLKGGFRKFLSTEMDRFNLLPANTLADMATRFTKVMKHTRRTFGDAAFAKFRNSSGDRMSTFNAAVYDSLSVAVAHRLKSKGALKPGAKSAFAKLFDDDKFFSSLEGSVNDKNKVVTRITKALGAIG